MTKTKEALLSELQDLLTTRDLLEIVDTINNWNNSLDSYQVYPMDYLDELYNHLTPTELIGMLGVNFDLREDYFKLTGYGHLTSLSIADLEEYYFEDYEEIMEAFLECHDHIFSQLFLQADLMELLEELASGGGII